MIGIYKITSPSKRIYIGQSLNVNRRINRYKKMLDCSGQPRLLASFIKYGTDKHQFEVLTECSESELNSLERYYQDLFHCLSAKGLNCKLTKAGDRCGKMDDISRSKMSSAKKGKQIPWLMTPRTAEHTKNLSNALKGIKAWNKGIARTNEEKALMSKNRVGKLPASEHPHSKLILNVETGIYYFGALEASNSTDHIKRHQLKDRFRGKCINNTAFRQV